MCDEISSRFNELKFQHGLKFFTIHSAPWMELFAKIISKRLHLRCFTGFWMRLCCVCDNYLSVNFLHNLFCYFLICGDSKPFLFQLFRSSMKLIHLHYNCGTEITGIRPWVSTWCPNIKKMKVQNVCILWSVLILSSPYEKICMVIKMTTFLA